MVGFVMCRLQQTRATPDMDATLIGTDKSEALYCYKKYKASGGGAEAWFHLQAYYELAQAMKKADEIEVESIEHPRTAQGDAQ